MELPDWKQWFRKPGHSREKNAKPTPEQTLLTDIREVRRQLEGLQSYFALETDEDLLEAAIYQRNALEARQRHLLRRAREQGANVADYAIMSEELQRMIQ
ncbi:MAG: DUF2508 family protein [Oscillospiraceae bacterium]|jgi:hypothetical protein|nr:DUF2508 family protein [Oscillospiraceae bacterium]